MEIKDEIKIFLNCRPDVVASYGYGSGVFEQTGYTKKDHPQIDLILAVKDIRQFHKENMELNPGDYSFTGKIFYNTSSAETIKGPNKITYQSNIRENGLTFKYGVIEANDLYHQLITWKRFYLAGRFQKQILEIDHDARLSKAIEANRRYALITALKSLEDYDDITELYEKIVSLSYIGDTRMKYFENPNKIKNIVSSSFRELDEIYNTNEFFEEQNGVILIDHEKLDREYLPAYLSYYLMNNKGKTVEDYLLERNKEESIAQTIHGIKTNGIVKSTDYAFQKLKKRIYKK